MVKFSSTNKSLNPDWPLTYKIMPLHFDESVLREFCFNIFFLTNMTLDEKRIPKNIRKMIPFYDNQSIL